eukprot:scaffold189062_cov48-Prasinocladus_malaysianus.AAC.1
MPWRQRFEWAPTVETDTSRAVADRMRAVGPADPTGAEEVEEAEELILVLVEEPGEDRYWRAADHAAMMVDDEVDWGDGGRDGYIDDGPEFQLADKEQFAAQMGEHIVEGLIDQFGLDEVLAMVNTDGDIEECIEALFKANPMMDKYFWVYYNQER